MCMKLKKYHLKCSYLRVCTCLTEYGASSLNNATQQIFFCAVKVSVDAGGTIGEKLVVLFLI